MGVGSYIRACVVGFVMGIAFLPLYASFALFRFAFGRFEREKKCQIVSEIHVKKELEKKKEEKPEQVEQVSTPDNQLDHEKDDKDVAKAPNEIRLPEISAAEAELLLKRHRAIPSIDITHKRRNRRFIGGRWESI